MNRALSGLVGSLLALALFLFVAVPLGAVLIKSVHLEEPLPAAEMRQVVRAALDKIEPQARAAQLERWLKSLDAKARMETVAATLIYLDRPVGWDRKGAFEMQIEAAEKAVAALEPGLRSRFEAEFPYQMVILHKRVPLAFRIKDQIPPAEFETLRSGTRPGFSLRLHTEFLTTPHLVKAAWNSVLVSTVTTVIAVTLAFALVYGLRRGVVPMPGAVRALVLLPLVSPPVIMAFAAILLFGRQGLITRRLLDGTLGLVEADSFNLYGFWGVVVAMVLSYLPHAYIVLDDVLARHGGPLEEAAASQGAGPAQIFLHVTLPLARPGILGAALVVFIQSMTDFGNPLVIGRGFPVLAGVVYTEITGFQNLAQAAALCLWLILPGLVGYALFVKLGASRRFATQASSARPPELPVPVMARRSLQGAALFTALAVVLFYGVVLAGSLTRVWGIDSTPTLDHFRLDPEFESSFARNLGLPLVWSSLEIAGMAALLGGFVSLAIAYLAERSPLRGRQALGLAAVLPGVVPGVLFGLGYLVAFNAPFGEKGLSLSGGAAILVLNILFANIYVGVLAGRATLQRLDRAIDEAAASLGASLAQTFWYVTLPLLGRVFVLATLYIFVHGMVTLSGVMFLVSP
ncbi:MAG: iron ABC transporter permease, partial [Rhodospirillales bacterium]|nr:iron ABC transporter permease [Rhodospirillales bacterium]